MRRILVFAVIAVLLALISISLKSSANSPPGRIRLLSGYKHKFDAFESTDSRIGKIWKDSGITITYDIGKMAGEWAKPEDQSKYLWYKEQIVNESIVRCALTRDNQMYVTFPNGKANFYGTVKSQEDIADFLLMVLSY